MDGHRPPDVQKAPVRFDWICDAVCAGHPELSRGFTSLVKMHGAEPFARQRLASLISRDRHFGTNIRDSHLASTMPRPDARPVTARDIIDHWGYRIIHSCSIATAVSLLVGADAFAAPHRDFWFRAFVVASYAGVLGDVLQVHDDEAYAAAFLRSITLFWLQEHVGQDALHARRLARERTVPLWDAETAVLGGSHLDLGRRLAERWQLPRGVRPAFVATGEPDSLADLLFRATAAAERHGFVDPAGPTLPAHLVPEREPILDAYFRRAGGTPQGMLRLIRGMLVLAPLDLTGVLD